jgi:hypothetical protein
VTSSAVRNVPAQTSASTLVDRVTHRGWHVEPPP